MMDQCNVHVACVVAEDGRLVGIVTELDLQPVEELTTA